MNYQVNEIFNSVQGEGVHSGIPATFIRLQGCTVGCVWCDTKYTWKKGGTKMSVDEIYGQVQNKLVIITGGEPTLWDLDELITKLKTNGHGVHLETSGQNALKGALLPDWLTWSPKENLAFECNQKMLPHVNEVKFVVDKAFNFEIAWSVEAKTVKACTTVRYPHIVLMPEGSPPTKESLLKASSFAQAMAPLTPCTVLVSDRLQYKLGVK